MRTLWTLESGIKTTHEEVKNFFKHNKLFFIYEEEGKLTFKSFNTGDVLKTSKIKNKTFKKNGYACVETQHTKYHLMKA